jgi:transcriptional regulator with XRE-family HTH domain
MDSERLKIRELAAELGISASSLSQIRMGSAGTERAVPKLEHHFRVLHWLDAPLGQFESNVDGTRAESSINDVWDVIMRLKLPARSRSQMAEVITVLWENQV